MWVWVRVHVQVQVHVQVHVRVRVCVWKDVPLDLAVVEVVVFLINAAFTQNDTSSLPSLVTICSL